MNGSTELSSPAPARVVVVGLASCFGCQVQITNAEAHLTEVLGQLDLQYWQLASSDPMPQDFDVAVIEGAVTTEESLRLVKELREKASCIIAIGACATTAGIPGMAAEGFLQRPGSVYETLPAACGEMIAPRAVSAVIPVDFEVRCCPVDSYDFIDILQQALYGSNKTIPTSTMCGSCKRNETACFYQKGILCLGLVTRSGCNARCVNLGRPCNACRGLSPDANLPAAREACRQAGIDVAIFDKALEMFNQTDPALRVSE